MKKERIFIVPNNDLEAKTIIELLEKNGEEYLVTEQPWGATWEGLEDEIKEQLAQRTKHVVEEVDVPEDEWTLSTVGTWGMEGDIGWSTNPPAESGKEYVYLPRKGTREEYLMSPKTEEYKLPSQGHRVGHVGILKRSEFHGYKEVEKEVLDTSVYGVELQGETCYHNIDHHIYGKDDRSNPKSSLEQVAEILGVRMSLDQLFVAANDKGFIPAMEKLGKELGMTEREIQMVVDNIRSREREAQGITIEQEAQAQEAVEKLGKIEGKKHYIEVELPHSKTATITDRLYGKYDNLLIISGDGETNFYGETEIISMLNERFPGGWSGGQLDKGSGFWGGYADQNAIREAVKEVAIKAEKPNTKSEK